MDQSNEDRVVRHAEYCKKLLSRYCFYLTSLQESVSAKWKLMIDDDNFDFFGDLAFKKHLDLFSAMAEARKEISGLRYFECVYKVWYGSLSIYIQESAHLIPPHIRTMLIDVGSQLASICVLNAEYDRAVICFNDVIKLDRSHSFARLALMRIVAELGEWDIMQELLRREEKLPKTDLPKHHNLFTRTFQVMMRVCTRKQVPSFEQINQLTNVYNRVVTLDYVSYEGAALEYRTRLMASRLPFAALKMIGDPIENRRLEVERLFVIQKSRMKAFVQFALPNEFMKKFDISAEFAKLAMSTAMLYEGLWNLTNESLETGLLKEAQNHAVQYLAYAMRTCIPFHVVRAATLVSKTFSYFDPSSSRSGDVQKVVELVLTLYDGNDVTQNFDLNRQYAKVVHAKYNSDESKAFLDSRGSSYVAHRESNRRMRKWFFDPSKMVLLDLTWHQLHPYLDVVCRCTTSKNKIDLGQKVLKRAVQMTEYHQIELCSYRLLLKVLAVPQSGVTPILSTNPDDVNRITKCLEALSVVTHPLNEKRAANKEVFEYGQLFRSFNHLFLREWRSRICSYMARQCHQPYERAFFLSEAFLCSIRQTMRANVGKSGIVVDETYLHASGEEFKADLKKLPSDLTVIQLFLDCENVLWFTRLHSKLKPFTVPLIDLSDDTVLKSIEEVLEANTASTKIKESRQFWTARKNLDKQLKEIVQFIENEWFGPLLPLMLPYTEELSSGTIRPLVKCGISKELAQVIMSSRPLSRDEREWKQLIKVVCSAEKVSFDKVLAAAMAIDCGSELQKVRESMKNKFTIFNIPAALSCLPFENMPFFNNYPLMCRIPSFKLFCNLIKSTVEVPKPVNCKRSYYILNPGGDLRDTEKRVGGIIQSYDFDGIVGSAPPSEEVKRVLNEYDVFLYVGHGSGCRYFSRNAIRSSDCKAVSVLMGCSSVAIQMDGNDFDGRSTVYDYMMARCPCIIGCLWLVTDGDIDKYLVALLDYCFAHLKTNSLEAVIDSISTKEGYRTFLRGIAEARKACRLPYLTGSSVVAFGVPVVTKIV